VSFPVTPTDQALARARLTSFRPRDPNPIPLCFNPSEYQLTKENRFAEQEVRESNAPPIQFERGGAEKLTFEALVDTSDTLEDVRTKYVDRIRALMTVATDSHAPPVVAFEWGDRPVFLGVLETLQVTYVLFKPDGVPVRARLNLTLKEWHEPRNDPPTSSPDVDKSYVVKRGDTLSSISSAAYKDPTQWRVIARANGILDPRALSPGSVLNVPRLR
jgi:nucleoid-associated protein YgaU